MFNKLQASWHWGIINDVSQSKYQLTNLGSQHSYYKCLYPLNKHSLVQKKIDMVVVGAGYFFVLLNRVVSSKTAKITHFCHNSLFKNPQPPPPPPVRKLFRCHDSERCTKYMYYPSALLCTMYIQVYMNSSSHCMVYFSGNIRY